MQLWLGIRVAVYGTIGPPLGAGAPKSSYVVDGSDPVIFLASQIYSVQYNQQFYQSPILSDGLHTLTVTNLLKSDRFYLDYFVVSNGTTTSSQSSRTPTTSTSNGDFNTSVIRNATATDSITLTVQTSTYESPAASETLIGSTLEHSGKPSRTAVISVSTIAALMVVTLFLCGVYVWRRQRRRLLDSDEQIITSCK